MKWIAMAVVGMVLGMVAAIIFVNVPSSQESPKTERTLQPTTGPHREPNPVRN